MLQTADKIRLERVKGVVSALNLRFPVAEVAKQTGENKGNVSKYLSGKLPIPDNFYTTFLEKFEKQTLGKRETPQDNSGTTGALSLKLALENQSVILASHKNISDANLILAHAVDKALSPKPIVNDLEEILTGMNATMRGIAELVTEVAAGKVFRSKEEAADMLHKKTGEQHQLKKAKGKFSNAGR